MGSCIFFPVIFLSCICFFSYFSASEIIYPNLIATHFKFIDQTGTFLISKNGTFKAAIYNPGGAREINYYLCVIHVESNKIIWSANRGNPISSSGMMNLTENGIVISEQGDSIIKWSTPVLKSDVYALMLAETGNLVLLDKSNGSLWQSFDWPTDTVVIGQKIPVGSFLSNSKSNDDFSTGHYTLKINTSDALLQWYGKTYWQLSMDTKAFVNSFDLVEYMAMNNTGLYLFGNNGSVVVIKLVLTPSNFRTAKLNSAGKFIVSSYSGTTEKQEFVWPNDACQLPLVCNRIGLCTNDDAPTNPVCSCPSGFRASLQNTSDCVPSNPSFTLPSSCNSTEKDNRVNLSAISYLRLGYGINYFSIRFSEPVQYGVNLSSCQDLCSSDCSCLAVLFENSSGSCYMLENELGSIKSSNTDKTGLMGYVKATVESSKPSTDFSNKKSDFPLIALVLLPFSGFSVFIALGFLCWRRKTLLNPKEAKVRQGLDSSPSSKELYAFSIPGLPRRLDYEEVKIATDDFKTHIGSGGFGSVYMGTLSDETLVAVKKINNLGVQGKKEFCTEIAIIGTIRHVNLVKLIGFCSHNGECMLVYEYMNRGSLDRTLFGNGPVLEWQERLDIALGTARGLAYLHSSVEQKIIHCDVKPENILLHDNFQVKISDFGLSKLLGTEQSTLFTSMRGTRGYLAPEWLTSSTISDKTDVYSYGMVLLELVSGRKNCVVDPSHTTNDLESGTGSHSASSFYSGLIYFPLLALEMHEQGRYMDLADPRLEGRVTSVEVEKLIRVALCCVHEEPMLRPNMVSVVGMLEGGVRLREPRLESLNFLRFYGRRFSEASMVEEGDGRNSDFLLHPHVNDDNDAIRRNSATLLNFSYIESQHVSGPR